MIVFCGLERWLSGLKRKFAKLVNGKPFQGFESLPHLLNKIISYFSENPTNSVNEVETKILKLKLTFSRVGELDQRYQN